MLLACDCEVINSRCPETLSSAQIHSELGFWTTPSRDGGKMEGLLRGEYRLSYNNYPIIGHYIIPVSKAQKSVTVEQRFVQVA